MTDEIAKLGSDPSAAKRVSYEQKGAEWYQVTRKGKAVARRKMRPEEVRRINPIPGPEKPDQ